jgi:hypothetical protein
MWAGRISGKGKTRNQEIILAGKLQRKMNTEKGRQVEG